MVSEVRARLRVVLLVAPDDEARAIYAGALRAAGMAVDLASGTVDAVRSAVTEPPELIIIDRDLPDGDGWALARKLGGRSLGRARVIIVGLGPSRGRDDMESALVAGCDVFLAKPCDPDMVVRTVRAMLGAQATKKLRALA